jgi:Flp pilus assembly protein TadB
MTAALVLGAGAGLGLWLIVLGFLPPQLALGESLRRLRLQPEPAPIATPAETPPGFLVRLGSPIARRLVPEGRAQRSRLLTGLVSAQDLAILGRSPERHRSERVGVAIAGLLLPAVAGLLLVAAGLSLSPLVPLWVAVLLGVGGFFLPDMVVRSEARERRAEFRQVLAAFTQVVALSLTSDSGLETALRAGAGAGTGSGFERLRSALRQASFGAETPWTALSRLGRELGVQELEELGARVSLAGHDGARVAESLTTFATTLRTRRLAEVEGQDRVASEKMAAATVMLFFGYTLFIVLPGFAHLLVSAP